MGISPNRAAHRDEFSNVQPTFAKLELGHECLSLSKTPAQFDLRNTRLPSSLDEQLDHSAIEIGAER